MTAKPKRHRRLIRVQMNLDEVNSLDPLLRARIIDRAHRESVKERREQEFQDTLDCEEEP